MRKCGCGGIIKWTPNGVHQLVIGDKIGMAWIVGQCVSCGETYEGVISSEIAIVNKNNPLTKIAESVIDNKLKQLEREIDLMCTDDLMK